MRRETDPWQRLEAACVAHLQTVLEAGDYAQVLIRVLPEDVPPAAAQLRLLRAGYERLFRGLVADLPLALLAPTADTLQHREGRVRAWVAQSVPARLCSRQSSTAKGRRVLALHPSPAREATLSCSAPSRSAGCTLVPWRSLRGRSTATLGMRSGSEGAVQTLSTARNAGP